MNEQVRNIKNPIIQRIADECTYRSVGDFGMTIVGGVKLEEFAKKCILEFSRLQIEATTKNSYKYLDNDPSLSVLTADAMREMGIK